MKRLTKRFANGTAYTTEPIWKHDSVITSIGGKAIDKLADYEDAEEQGLLVRLPCKIGDAVWAIRNYRGTRYAQQGFVNDMYLTQEMKLIIVVKNIARGEFGKEVFLTKEDAEMKLAELTEKRNYSNKDFSE